MAATFQLVWNSQAGEEGKIVEHPGLLHAGTRRYHIALSSHYGTEGAITQVWSVTNVCTTNCFHASGEGRRNFFQINFQVVLTPIDRWRIMTFAKLKIVPEQVNISTS